MSVVCCSRGWTKIGIFQLCTVRLSWNLVDTSGWYPKLACMLWFWHSLVCLHFVNPKTPKSWKLRFSKLEISPPFEVLIDCLHFVTFLLLTALLCSSPPDPLLHFITHFSRLRYSLLNTGKENCLLFFMYLYFYFITALMFLLLL
jgi:hypothetical protein